MKPALFINLLLLLKISIVSGQGSEFSYLEPKSTEQRIMFIADSLKCPLLITTDKIYAIGSNCITRLLDGGMNDRDRNGDNDDRLDDGSNNDRNQAGGSSDRISKGKNNNRKKKGGDNDRDRDGDNNDRDKDGDNNERDRDGDTDDRNADGGSSNGTRCSVAKNGKVLLYTRQSISSESSRIYYKTQYFGPKYFKIIKI